MAKRGVYLCSCGTSIAGAVDVDEALAFARTLPARARDSMDAPVEIRGPEER